MVDAQFDALHGVVERLAPLALEPPDGDEGSFQLVDAIDLLRDFALDYVPAIVE